MRLLAIVFCLVVSGCATLQPGISIEWHRTLNAPADCIKLRKDAPQNTVGCSKMIEGICHIWAPDTAVRVINGKRIAIQGQWATLGHEVKHCFDGDYHD